MKNSTSAVKVAVGDYVIAKVRTAESHVLIMGKATEIAKGVIVGYQAKNAHLQKLRKPFEIIERDVVLNLGAQPYCGSVLKFDTSHIYSGKKITHDFFGPLYFFYHPSKEVLSMLGKAFDKCADILRKAGLPEPVNTVWEINPKEMKGKWAGFYRHSKNPAKAPSTLSIKPEAVPIAMADFCYVILHEYGHYLHFNHIRSPKVNAAWIKLFNTSIKPQTIDRDMLKKLLAGIMDGEERPQDYRGQLEEQERNAFNWVLRTIKQDHAVGLKELNLLFEAEQKDEIANLWPKRSLNKKELAPIVSEYATTNYKELFAETFAFHFTKRKLPTGIVSLLERTLKRIEDIDEPAAEEE